MCSSLISYNVFIKLCRSEGLTPNGIFGPWAWWSRGLARWESCRRAVVAVGVTWKLGSGTVLVFGLNRSHMRDLGSSVGASCVKFGRAPFLEKSQNIEKSYFQYFQDIRKFQETCSKNNPRQHNTTRGAARCRPPGPPLKKVFNIMSKYQKSVCRIFPAE